MPAITLPRFRKNAAATDPGHSVTGQVDKPFNLIRSYAITSLIVMLIIGGLAATLLSSYLGHSLIRRDAIVSQAFLQSLTEVEGGADLFSGEKSTGRISSPEQAYGLPELVDHIATMPDVVRANLYSNEGKVLWSTRADLIGRHFDANHELEDALAGATVFELKDVKEEHKAEYEAFGTGISQLVENYLPIRDLGDNSVVAVVEIYKAPQTLFDAIRSARLLVWVSVAGATLFLYASLFWIVYRASQLIRAQQLRLVESETLVAVGEMASAVAHSIRNPLAAIRSSAELTADGSDDSMVRETSEDIITEIDRVEQWVRELLIFCRPEGSTEFNTAYLDQILNRSLQDYEHLIKRNQVKLVAKKGEHIPAVRGDPGMLGQMFNSILANALEAMPGGGILTTEIQADKKDRMIEILISDTGHGIPRARLETIFETCLTTKRYGLGMGMLLVKRVVDRHAGSISLSSREGGGTTACLRFPLR
ncbi:MAG: ATP-binding protein [Gammaproteobacteria bacterium]|nr:ATP-binding protein [Gammaproteobacteria bacterium]MDH3449015.1 ATP-binding protein [Gammaproteobacteria bacterium]